MQKKTGKNLEVGKAQTSGQSCLKKQADEPSPEGWSAKTRNYAFPIPSFFDPQIGGNSDKKIYSVTGRKQVSHPGGIKRTAATSKTYGLYVGTLEKGLS